MDSSNNIVIDQLARTRGWTLFFAVLLWLGAALLMSSGVIVAVMAAIGSSGAMGSANPFNEMGGPAVMIGIGVAYFLIALAYIYPALKLTSFSKKVSHLIASPSEEGLASALNEQRAFWKYVGILMIIFMALYILLIIGALVFGMVGAAGIQGA